MSIGAFSGKLSGGFKLGDALKTTSSRDHVDVVYVGAKQDLSFKSLNHKNMLDEINNFPNKCNGQT